MTSCVTIQGLASGSEGFATPQPPPDFMAGLRWTLHMNSGWAASCAGLVLSNRSAPARESTVIGAELVGVVPRRGPLKKARKGTLDGSRHFFRALRSILSCRHWSGWEMQPCLFFELPAEGNASQARNGRDCACRRACPRRD